VILGGPTDRVPPFRFSVGTRVRFNETDAVGVVYYGRYPPYFDLALAEYRRHLGLPLLGAPGHMCLVRWLHAEYHSSARFDDPIEVFVRIARLGTTSHTAALRVEGIAEDGPHHLADGRVTIVGVERHGGPASPMPEDTRRRIAAFEGDALES
jgi:acyl-CoA thioester hydrolase